MNTSTLYLRQIRETKGVTLEQLAQVLKVEVSYLTKLENLELVPAASELLKIANALGTDISALITGKEFVEKKAQVTRQKERVTVDRHSSFTYESLAPSYSGRHIEPFIIKVYHQETGALEFSSHIGEEFHYVLQGDVRITVGGEDYALEPGDSLYFDSSLPHALNAVGKSSTLVSAIYNGESMLQLTRSKYMRDLIQTAKLLGGRDIAVVCPDKTVMDAVNKGIEERVIRTAYLIGDIHTLPKGLMPFKKQYSVVQIPASDTDYFKTAAENGVRLIKDGICQMLMKGQINSADFVRAILNKKTGITTGRRLSLISLFELPEIDRLIFLTDPGINPELVAGKDLQSSIDIINNAIDVARSMGVARPKVALLEANEVPTDSIPTTMYEKQLSEMEWERADVFGPLSYDLALYEAAGKKKKLKSNPVSGKADILVVPHISGGNFLYKAWAMTLNAEVASIVVGARAPIIMTSRNDNDKTKFLTICACSVFSEYLKR